MIILAGSNTVSELIQQRSHDTSHLNRYDSDLSQQSLSKPSGSVEVGDRQWNPTQNKGRSDGHQQTACQRQPVPLWWWIWGWFSVHWACVMRAREDRAQWTLLSELAAHKQTLLCGDQDPHLSTQERASTEKEQISRRHITCPQPDTHFNDRID